MPATPYDVIIDGKGYIIKDGTYAAGKQQLAADQFRTGDPGYATLRDQQALPQTDWRGGATNFGTPSDVNFSSSNDIEILRDFGSFRLANLFSAVGNGIGAENLAKGIYNGDLFVANNSLLQYKNLSASNWSAGANLSTPGLRSFENFGGKLYVTAVSSQTLWASNSPKTAAAWSAELSSMGFSPAKIVGFQSKLYISEDLAAFSIPGPTLRQYDGVSVADVFTSNTWLIINMCVYSGRLYLGCVKRNDPTTYALRVYDGSTDWTVETFEHADTVATNAPNNSFNVMRVFNGKLYFNIADYEYQNQLMSFDGQSIAVSLPVNAKKAQFSTFYANAYADIYDTEIINGSFYVLVRYVDVTTPVHKYYIWTTQNGEYWYKYHEVAASSNTTIDGVLLPKSNAGIFSIELQKSAGSVAELKDFQSLSNGVSSFQPSGTVTSNILDMDLFSIDKRISSFEVYHSALATNNWIKADLFSYGDSSAQAYTATITNSNAGSTQTIIRPTNAVGKTFQYTITLSASYNSSATPLVNDVVARWVLEPEDKGQWTFDVICVDNLQLNDGSYEKRTGDQIRKDLEAARKKAITSFTDINGATYNQTLKDTDNRGVIVKDIQFKGPYDMSDKGVEFIATVVLVQA